MPYDLALDGWLMYFIVPIVYITFAASIALVIDALRRPSSDFTRLGKVPWLLVQAMFFGLSLVAVFGDPGSSFKAGLGMLFLIAFVQQIAYLLRVVFPSPERQAARQPNLMMPKHTPEEHVAHD